MLKWGEPNPWGSFSATSEDFKFVACIGQGWEKKFFVELSSIPNPMAHKVKKEGFETTQEAMQWAEKACVPFREMLEKMEKL